jgi:hypothetical protein
MLSLSDAVFETRATANPARFLQSWEHTKTMFFQLQLVFLHPESISKQLSFARDILFQLLRASHFFSVSFQFNLKIRCG